MRRHRQIRRRSANITPAAIEARRRMVELTPAVKACDEARSAAEKRRDFTAYHSLLPPCGEGCVCAAQHEAWLAVTRELRLRPWDFGGELEAGLHAELDELAAPATEAE